ncbi:S41 family peptidase [Aureisphaera galaxeae]|uniref:S41 family peptidase n=1 Tax=Aureisphaera galaxeae TaxID=1538023 RepID=UPI002350D191|nr:S41 family peptidase [Aureisphaera galaxeae]MDC8003959.1 S41 family peptidase [Aureisphaera galaxeae]
MKTKLALLMIVSIVFASCQEKNPENNSINGVWESVGSGWVLQIQDSTQYSLYDITAISCLPSRSAGLNEIESAISLENDTLSFKKGVMEYQFTRAEDLPELCAISLSPTQKIDPLYNFEVFAATVKEHYAFMELNSLNWDALYLQQKTKLSEESTMAELYTVIEETLELLNDNHAYLEATDEVYEMLAEEEEEEDNGEAPLEYGDFQVANLVAGHHIDEDMTQDSWLMKWGIMDDDTGYVVVKAMWLYADLNIPQSLIDEVGFVDAYVETFHKMDEGSYIKKEVQGVTSILDRAMNDLKDTEQIIIDMRFNGGGQDAVSFEILKRFNPERRHVVTTKLKTEQGYSSEQRLYLDSTPKAYTNPVFVLTSQQTGSAAEAFSICSMAVPHMKRIGTHTQGALSTALEKALPNGWVFSISNEVYMDTKNNSYENVGVPVDYEIPFPKDRQSFFRSVANDLEEDKKRILKAIRHVGLQEQI